MSPEPFESKKRIRVSVKPTTEFASGDTMRSKGSRDFSGSFRTLDVGQKGGMTATVGKSKTEVHLEGPAGAETSIQAYNLDKKNVKIEDKQLVGKNQRGTREINQIKRSQGNIEHISKDQLIVTKNRKLFDRVDYFKDTKGGMRKANRLNKESLEILKRKKIPEAIIRKMNSGKELSEYEKDVLHKHGLEYVRSNKRKSFVREYRGGTEARLRSLNL